MKWKTLIICLISYFRLIFLIVCLVGLILFSFGILILWLRVLPSFGSHWFWISGEAFSTRCKLLTRGFIDNGGHFVIQIGLREPFLVMFFPAFFGQAKCQIYIVWSTRIFLESANCCFSLQDYTLVSSVLVF